VINIAVIALVQYGSQSGRDKAYDGTMRWMTESSNPPARVAMRSGPSESRWTIESKCGPSNNWRP